MSKRKVGIVGYGSLGQFLAHKILDDQKISAELEIVFIWNRSADKITSDPKIDKKLIIEDLSQFPSCGAGNITYDTSIIYFQYLHYLDIIVEVAHPDITAKYGGTHKEIIKPFL
jgi:homoserine dehydrogenase